MSASSSLSRALETAVRCLTPLVLLTVLQQDDPVGEEQRENGTGQRSSFVAYLCQLGQRSGVR